MGPVAAMLPGNRLHLQHGPIDLIIGADGDREAAFRAATRRFETVLPELVGELDLLRAPLASGSSRPEGPVALRMDAAARPFADVFLTRMAAVAGAVADEILAAMLAEARLSRAYVNDGGDIAVHLDAGETFTLAISDPEGRPLGHVRIAAGDGIGGIATSGWRGRSHSFGIADSVTVLAADAATADVAATLIANVVDLPEHPAITRCPANDLSPDTDLGHRLVTTGRGPLSRTEIGRALSAGQRLADSYSDGRRIAAAALFLDGESILTGRAGVFQTERNPILA